MTSYIVSNVPEVEILIKRKTENVTGNVRRDVVNDCQVFWKLSVMCSLVQRVNVNRRGFGGAEVGSFETEVEWRCHLLCRRSNHTASLGHVLRVRCCIM
jgi:hypothetical protein